MKYLGSKNRISKHILPILLKHRGDRTWVEPFVGGANMIDKVSGNRIGSDINEYVISLLNQMSKPNYEAPEISEEKYNDIKQHPDQYPRWVVGYAGTQLSFGSTWFGSYRRDREGKRNYSKEAQTNVNAQAKKIQGVVFLNRSYLDLEIPESSFIYCDPPYDTKATIGKYKDGFNHSEFWQWCRDKSNEGHVIIISEYSAPDDFSCIWEMEINQRMNNAANTSKTHERLFSYCQ